MIDLIIVACLLASPAECKQDVITMSGNLMQCHWATMLSAARWQTDNPKWRVRRLECRDHGIDV